MSSQKKNEWLRSLVLAHESRLLRYVVRLGTSPELSREIVQETFLRLWKEDPAALKGREVEWLFCVSRNLCFDTKKKENRTMKRAVKRAGGHDDPTSKLRNAVDDLPSNAPNADEAIEEREQENAITRAIGDLPKNQQEVVRLKFQEGFSYKEISSITGLSVSHVGVLIHEAMTRLRREFAFANQNSASQGGSR